MIRFTCPRCDAALKVSDDRAGEKIKCPKCGRAAAVPESLDDPPAAELDETPRRWLSRRAWMAIAAVVLVLAAVVGVMFVRSGTRDGMTRAEREAFESNFRSELVGVWDATEGPEWKEPDEGSRHLFTFTEDGRFEAVRYRDGKKVGSHSGRWSVTGKKLAVEVDESADDSVSTSKMVPSDIYEIKSEKGRMLRFALGRYQQAGYHTFRRWEAPAQPNHADNHAIVGRWELVSAIGMQDGVRSEYPGDRRSQNPKYFRFDRGRLETSKGDTAVFVLDPAKSPKWITVTFDEGPPGERFVDGIYELKGDELRVCWAPRGKQGRPASFTDLGRDGAVMVFRRAR